MPDYRLLEVRNTKDLQRWLDFTDQLYSHGLFVPPIRQNILRLFHNKTPYQKEDIKVKFLIVEDAHHNVLARSTCHSSLKFNKKMSNDIQLFGFTEFTNDFNVFRFLFSELKRIAREADSKMLLGPANLLPNQFGGVITSGFAHRGFVDNVYNYPYYPEFYKDFGFKNIFESQTFICENLNENPNARKLFSFDEKRIEEEGLQLHFGQRSRFTRRQLPILLEMLNASFAVLKYYTNISKEELKCQTDGIQFIMENELFIYLTKNGKPIGFILCLPDLSDFIRGIKGNLNTINLINLLLKRSRYKQEAILIIKGVIPEESGKGYMELISQKLLENLEKLGYHTLRTTWVETDNKASAAHFLKMNGKVLHDINFFQMAL